MCMAHGPSLLCGTLCLVVSWQGTHQEEHDGCMLPDGAQPRQRGGDHAILHRITAVTIGVADEAERSARKFATMSLTQAEVRRMKVAELRDALAVRGLATDGRKAVLAARLAVAAEAEAEARAGALAMARARQGALPASPTYSPRSCPTC